MLGESERIKDWVTLVRVVDRTPHPHPLIGTLSQVSSVTVDDVQRSHNMSV